MRRNDGSFSLFDFCLGMVLIGIVISTPGLAETFTKGSVLDRRRVVRELEEKGVASRPMLARALRDDDLLVRRNALRALCEIDSKNIVIYAEKMFEDSSEYVRLEAIEQLAQIDSPSEKVTQLLVKGLKDKSSIVAKAANRALWPFHRKNVPIRQRVDIDHELDVVKTIELPAAGWKFMNDVKNNGHVQKWYEVKYDDKKWMPIEIEKEWGEFGQQEVKTGWYRLKFTLPEKMEHDAVELSFGGVDENAWVWLNGIYIGEHAVGPIGWDHPFGLDVTNDVKWGQANQITVRVTNAALAGGIWKPIKIEVIKIRK